MGADDDADCVEHVWAMVGMTCGWDGTHIEWACERCGVPMVQGPDELAGRV